MRTILAAAALTALTALPALAQPVYGGGFPPGSYQRQCTNLRMEGHFLHGVCRGARGGGESSINVESCSTDIFVDDSGALTCIGPGGGAPPAGYTTRQQTYDRRNEDRGYRQPDYQARSYQGSGAWQVCSEPGFRGRCVVVRESITDVRSLGFRGSIASMRPAR